jgi:uncharacterized protein YbcV (DUF1398 family)
MSNARWRDACRKDCGSRHAIAQHFSTEGVPTALRIIQAAKCNYPEFLSRVTQAGTTSYAVYLNGQKAIYFGRNGEFHIEEFPRAKP